MMNKDMDNIISVRKGDSPGWSELRSSSCEATQELYNRLKPHFNNRVRVSPKSQRMPARIQVPTDQLICYLLSKVEL